MIKIDILKEDENNIQIYGDYATVAYEVSKAIASFLLVYVPDPNDYSAVVDILGTSAIGMIPEIKEQVAESGTLLRFTNNVLGKLREEE